MALTMKIDGNSWHGRLFIWSYSVYNQRPPPEFDGWQYGTTILAAVVFLLCAVLISVVLNIGTIPFGVIVEPIWRRDARFRRLTFPGGIPIIAVAVPIWLGLAAWREWTAYGIVATLAPFVITAIFGFALLGSFVLFNRARRKLPKLRLAEK